MDPVSAAGQQKDMDVDPFSSLPPSQQLSIHVHGGKVQETCLSDSELTSPKSHRNESMALKPIERSQSSDQLSPTTGRAVKLLVKNNFKS